MTTLEGLEAKLDRLLALIEPRRETGADQPELLTPKQAAKALAVCTKTLRMMVKRGQIRTVPVGAHWRVPLSEVRRFATPKAKGAAPRRRAAEPYDARAEFEKGMARLGGRR